MVYFVFVKNGCKERQIMFGQVIACNEKLSIPVPDTIHNTQKHHSIFTAYLI